jgi:hypothetical protein
MLAISLAFLLLLGGAQQSDPSQATSNTTPLQPDPAQPDHVPADIVLHGTAPKTALPDPATQKRIAEFRARNEPHRQAAIRINEMAGNIHSEKDARAFVDAVAEELTNHKHLMWAALTYRRRVAHAEYEAVSDPGNLISEQRVADVWNEYVREIDAPEQALVTVDEIHRLRAGRYRMSQMMWQREFGQTIWTMPNVHAVSEDGTLADSGRPLEMLDVLNRLYNTFPDVLFGRERVHKVVDIPAGDPKLVPGNATTRVFVRSSLELPADPIRPAEARYQRDHGEGAYRQLLERLFAELFPPQ